jgi:NAD-dependent SIR2 family protein deacetylase
MRAKAPLPRCPICKEPARPNILMFGDWGWLPYRTESQQSRFREWLHKNSKKQIAIVECGAGTGVPTVRMTSESVASTYNAALIRINTREPHVPPGQIAIPTGALETIEKINFQIVSWDVSDDVRRI